MRVDPETVTLVLVAILKDSMIVPAEFLSSKVPVPLVIASENISVKLASIATRKASSAGDVEVSVGGVVSWVPVIRLLLLLSSEVIKLYRKPISVHKVVAAFTPTRYPSDVNNGLPEDRTSCSG